MSAQERPGGNYTQPEYVHPGRYEYIAYVGWVEVGRFDSAQEAEQAVNKGVQEMRDNV